MARAVRSGSRVDIAILIVCGLLALLGAVLPLPTRDAVAGVLQRSLAAPLLSLQRRSERARSAFVERDRLTASVDSLALRLTTLSQFEQENERLRELLALGSRLGRNFVTADALHGQGLGDTHTLLLTVGSGGGVKPRSAVVTPEGVVGLVTSVNPSTSVAIMWSHPDFRVSAMSADGSTFGIIAPHLSGAEGCGDIEGLDCADPERLLLELRGVAFRDALKPGTPILSSGLGGVFPRGVAVGTVIGEVKTPEPWSRTYMVRPAVRPQNVSNVIVLDPAWTTENVASHWSSPAAADSAVRLIVGAGDSLRRQAAAAVAARQRALDSIAAALAAPVSPALVPGDTVRTRVPPTVPIRPVPPGARDSVRRPPVRRDSTRRGNTP
jgi:rod shape-determining protein MreC